MDIEIPGLVGLAFAAIALARVAYERHMDVLYGPYIRGRANGLSVKRFWQPTYLAIERMLSLEGATCLPAIGAY